MSDRNFFTLRRNLGLQLSTLFLLFVALVFIAAFVFIRSSSDHLESDIISADLALANAIAAETDTSLSSATSAVQELANQPAVIDMDTDGMDAIFANVMSVRNDVNLIYRLDPSGIMQFHYPVGPESTVGTDFSFRPYFQSATTSTRPLISSGRISPTTNQPVATAVMPIWSEDGQFLGVVAMNMKLQFLSDTLTDIANNSYGEEDIQIAIIDHEGQIIAHSDAGALLTHADQSMPRVTKAVLAGESGYMVNDDNANSQERIYSYVPILDNNWGVIVSRPTDTAFAVISTFQVGTFMVLVVFLLSGLLFWWRLSGGLIQPLEKLATLSQRMWIDTPEPVSFNDVFDDFSKRSDQMGILTRSLQNLQQAIEARLHELATLLKTSTAVVSTLDSQAVLERILAQVEQLLDVQMSAIFVLDKDANVFRVEASRNLPEWYAEQVMIDPQDPRSVAMRAIHTEQPVQVSDTETDPSYVHNRNRARRAGYRAVLAIRLPVQHTPEAVLMVARNIPYTFNERELHLLTSFANHATMAIENAALFARSDMHLQEQTRRLQALIQSMGDGLVLEDSEGNILYANRRVQALLGAGGEPLEHKPASWILDRLAVRTQDADVLQETLAKLLVMNGVRQAEFDQLQTDGQLLHLKLTLFDVRDARDILIGRGWIIEDITQQYAIERMRSMLVATVSHELRTPLAAIKGYATTLLAEDVEWDTQSQHEFLTIISQETDKLSQLVQNLLDMSRIEGGNFTIRRSMCDLSQLIGQAAEHVAPHLETRLKVNLPPNLPPLYVDPQRFTTILRNLIENAVKYSPADKEIKITGGVRGQELIISVADQGTGIPIQHQAHIFERFYRGNPNQGMGAGLGLTIARSFVQIHNGEIWLEPSKVGTCIAFSIPLTVDLDHKQEEVL